MSKFLWILFILGFSTVSVVSAQGTDPANDLFNAFHVDHYKTEPQQSKVDTLLGKRVPDVTLGLISGDKVSLTNHIGHNVVFLDFWGTWCAPCRKAFPEIGSLSEELKNTNVVFYAISCKDNREKLTSFLSEQKHVPLVATNGTALKNLFGVCGVPHFTIIDSNGIIQHESSGYRSDLQDYMRRIIQQVCDGKQIWQEASEKKQKEKEGIQLIQKRETLANLNPYHPRPPGSVTTNCISSDDYRNQIATTRTALLTECFTNSTSQTTNDQISTVFDEYADYECGILSSPESLDTRAEELIAQGITNPAIDFICGSFNLEMKNYAQAGYLLQRCYESIPTNASFGAKWIKMDAAMQSAVCEEKWKGHYKNDVLDRWNQCAKQQLMDILCSERINTLDPLSVDVLLQPNSNKSANGSSATFSGRMERLQGGLDCHIKQYTSHGSNKDSRRLYDHI